MAASLRLALLGIVGVCVLPSIGVAQSGHGGGHKLFGPAPPMSAQQVADHLYGYYAGNHHHGGYGYAGGAGYGYGGGVGSSYGGGFFFPGYGNTYGLYPYGAGYNFSPPNYAPPPALTTRYPLSTSSRNLDRATGLPLLPSSAFPSTASPTQPAPAVATIRVFLPEASAKVLLDGNATTSLGVERTYASPPLEVGGKYTYTVIATWSHDGVARREARTALVTPGETTILDFTRPENADASPPPARIDPSVAAVPPLKL